MRHAQRRNQFPKSDQVPCNLTAPTKPKLRGIGSNPLNLQMSLETNGFGSEVRRWFVE
jgi:hypothetical protein